MVFADNFIPFFGVVEDVEDPKKLGRVRVRCFGYHTDNPAQIPTERLPWFSSVVSNSAGVNGGGDSPTGYTLNSTVFGYFLDRTYQVGIVVGSLVGETNGTPDLSGLAIQNPNHPLYDLRSRNRVKEIQETDRNQKWSEPEYINKSQYPRNKVFESEGGLIREMDGTPSQERIHEYHPSGSYYEVRPDGTRVVKVVADQYEIVAGDNYVNVRGTCNLTVDSNCKTLIKGDWDIQVSGNKKEIVMGNVNEYYGSQKTQVLSEQLIVADSITQNANAHVVNPGEVEFEEVPVVLNEQYELEFVRAGLSETGRNQEFDETDTVVYTPPEYPQDVPPETFNGNVKEQGQAVQETKDTPELSDCINITLPINYNTRLSENFTIANLSTRALFPHQIRSQVGLSEQEIVCNLQTLCQNVLEPIRSQFGSFRINSGFRVGAGRSQHNKGQACDIQTPEWSAKKHLEVAEWIANNLVFDQLILEHGRSVWIHVSFDRTKTKQRGQLLTMIGGKFQPGLKLYY